MKKLRILIADDHAIVRFGISTLINSTGDMEVTAMASNGEEAVETARRLAPDIVIMDLMMLKKDGIAATQEIKESLPETKILLLTTFSTSDGIAAALKAGASGAILKSSENDELISALRRIAAGESVISDEVADLLCCDPPLPPLSHRQIQILEEMAKGRSSKEIADKLKLQKDSVDKYVHNLMRKINASSRTEAVAIALKKRLLDI
ncbi:MAG: response regulator transcription factor [Kiritimatiellae bacterium]|nr:response regulator transcription factor [Kiritimatiellia bacterium]